jgi:transposase
MKAYSLDLRERVVAAYEAGQITIKDVAGRFSVGETFVKKMLRQKRIQGSVQPPAHGWRETANLDCPAPQSVAAMAAERAGFNLAGVAGENVERAAETSFTGNFR